MMGVGIDNAFLNPHNKHDKETQPKQIKINKHLKSKQDVCMYLKSKSTGMLCDQKVG